MIIMRCTNCKTTEQAAQVFGEGFRCSHIFEPFETQPKTIDELLENGGHITIEYLQCFEANAYLEPNTSTPYRTGFGSTMQCAWEDLLRGLPFRNTE